MAKITKIEDKTYQGKVTGHIITLSDGTTGYLADKVSDNVRVGDEVDCTIEVKKNKPGGEYNLLTLRFAQQGNLSAPPPTPAPAPTQPQQSAVKPPMQQGLYSASKSINEMKHDMRLKALETLGMLAAGGKIEPDEIIEMFNKFYPSLDSSYDVLVK